MNPDSTTPSDLGLMNPLFFVDFLLKQKAGILFIYIYIIYILFIFH